MAQLASWPSITDDSGQGQDGTVVNKAYSDSVKASIEDNIHSTNNTSIKCKDIIDEVKTARGSKSSLDARFDQEHNEDGTHKTLSYASVAQLQQQLAGVNLISNSDMYLWTSEFNAPSYFTDSGSVSRDTSVKKIGPASAKLNNAILRQYPLDASAFDNIFQTFNYACGAWVKTSYANMGELQSSFDGTGVKHTGSGDWEWLTLTGSGSGLTDLGMWVSSLSTQDVWTDGWVMLISPVVPTGWRPSLCEVEEFQWRIAGTISTGTAQRIKSFYRPVLIKDVWMHAKTTPAGADLIIDMNKNGGSSVFDSGGSRPTISDGYSTGGGRPGVSDTFVNRVIDSAVYAIATGYMTLDVDQVGSTTAGADLTIDVRYLQYKNPLEAFRNYDDEV